MVFARLHYKAKNQQQEYTICSRKLQRSSLKDLSFERFKNHITLHQELKGDRLDLSRNYTTNTNHSDYCTQTHRTIVCRSIVLQVPH